MNSFNNYDLPEMLAKSLERLNFTTATPIQAQTLPLALAGHDVLGSAQTGTGKTAAFSLPMITHLLNNQDGKALILAPTRELASQVLTFVNQLLTNNKSIKTALLIGGEPMPKQMRQLGMKPRIIVGTPGRVNDHLNRGSLHLDQVDFFVLDEIDRMLDVGFGEQLETIAQYLPPKRQTLMFSATLPKSIERLAAKYLQEPKRISVGAAHRTTDNIKLESATMAQEQKYDRLVQELDSREGSIIVFAKTKRSVEKISYRLSKDKHSSDYIHGDLKQSRRDRVIQAFRKRKHRILIATDVAARGLDIPHIEHVINFDLPQCPEDYIHRIGRTARAGSTGSAMCFIAPDERSKWGAIQRLLGGDESSNESPSQGRSRNNRSSQNRSRSEKSFSKARQDRPKSKFKKDRSDFDDRQDRPKSKFKKDRANFDDRQDRPKPNFKKDRSDFDDRQDRPKPKFKKDGSDFDDRQDRPKSKFKKDRADFDNRKDRPKSKQEKLFSKPRTSRDDSSNSARPNARPAKKRDSYKVSSEKEFLKRDGSRTSAKRKSFKKKK